MNNSLQVFRDEPGFMKLFGLFRDKFRSLGRVGGFVSLKGFKDAEVESIAGFLGLSSNELIEKGRVGLLQFERELANTGFSNLTFVELLEEIFQEPLLSKKQEAENNLRLENEFITLLNLEIPEAGWWLEWISERGPDTRWIWSLYRQDELLLSRMIRKVSNAFLSLPKKGDFERLPFFAQRTTGNPHFFDISELGGRLLLHFLAVNKKTLGEPEFPFPKNTEEINDLLAEFGLLRDDLWNFVTVQGLIAFSQGETHPVWNAAVQTRTVLNVPMKELARLESIRPASGRMVWIVENSSVASTIMDAVPDAAVVCTHGQLRAASWRLLDQLAEGECTFLYSGDLDPEGVLIADRLKKRYRDKLVLWRMDPVAYEISISNEDIAGRIAKLDGVSSQEWEEVVRMMCEKKKAGYQEALLDLLIEDIKQAQ
ncbi:TIGR02679 family protein [Bacillus sp. ISL-55]|uniref:TIGR02679 family protein n=1 Tax=Bacillus sp. ISL-55 TaxID=2819134 RepID=UPI001BEBC086|nr:TIGR02679 family protein [Bacillus sp. ISL-55]MBT2691736.1 TIGR02679 family protein [Bacillus sp. ISL-55]